MPLLHFTCRQLSQLRLHNDDVLFRCLAVQRIIAIGRVVKLEKGTSPRGMALLIVKITDSSGIASISIQYR
jgi:hypothetical protein